MAKVELERKLLNRSRCEGPPCMAICSLPPSIGCGPTCLTLASQPVVQPRGEAHRCASQA